MTYPQTKLPSFTPRFPPCPPSPSVTSCPPPYLYVISCLLSLLQRHFLPPSFLPSPPEPSLLLRHFLPPSLLTSFPVSSPYVPVTSCPLSLGLSLPVSSPCFYVISRPPRYFMSLPVPSVYFYIPSCPHSLLPCHFLSRLLHHFLPPFPTWTSLPAHSPYVYVTSCPHRYANL